MKNKELIKTNLLISIVLIFGFLITAIFSYRASYQTSLHNIEHVSSLTTEGIYYQFTTIFTKPVNVSLTMAHDSLLVEHLSDEAAHQSDEAYTGKTQNYLEKYREKYHFDSIFLVSSATQRYYNFNGIDRILSEDNPENEWYFNLMNSAQEYSLNVDNDEVDGADNAITVFVNCKIYGPDKEVLGIVGVGIRVTYLKELLKSYEKKYDVEACLIDEDGIIEISTTYTGYSRTDWFKTYGQEELRNQVLEWKEDQANLALWTDRDPSGQEKRYTVSRYIPELSWHLVVEQNNGKSIAKMKSQLYLSGFIIAAITLIVLALVSIVIHSYNKQISQLIEERQDAFQRATAQLYDNIYELNITKNCTANKRTAQYFESLGARDLPYNQGLKVIAEREIKEEYREGYIATFTPENVLREYTNGNSHLRYDFMITQDGSKYFWMRIDAYTFFTHEDNCIHMFTYRKNIEVEKKRELLASIDEMTKFLTKTATERTISAALAAKPEELYALFLFDIDDFKQANDCFGHAFGDHCIIEFTKIIKCHFRENDILGRVGGDEFAAFIPIPDTDWAEKKAADLCGALNFACTKDDKTWAMAASIGISIAPAHGTDFNTLYQKADSALYYTKQQGKNGYTVWNAENFL